MIIKNHEFYIHQWKFWKNRKSGTKNASSSSVWKAFFLSNVNKSIAVFAFFFQILVSSTNYKWHHLPQGLILLYFNFRCNLEIFRIFDQLVEYLWILPTHRCSTIVRAFFIHRLAFLPFLPDQSPYGMYTNKYTRRSKMTATLSRLFKSKWNKFVSTPSILLCLVESDNFR